MHRLSRLATWSAALCEWHGEVVPRIPVEREDIMCVAAILKPGVIGLRATT